MEGAKPLYDPTGRIPAQPEPSDATRPGDPYFPAAAVDLFFYFLGNLVVTFGRDELVVAQGGIVAVRAGLIDLWPNAGFDVLTVPNGSTAYLGVDQRAFLESVPGADVTRNQIAHAVQAISSESGRRRMVGLKRMTSTYSLCPMIAESAPCPAPTDTTRPKPPRQDWLPGPAGSPKG